MDQQTLVLKNKKCGLSGHVHQGLGVHATEKANAENIIKGLKSVIEKNLKIKWNDIVSKLVALSCDGASVNTGQKVVLVPV